MMKVGLYTDAPKHNLAIMKLSAYFKAHECGIIYNLPLLPCDVSYASILFQWNIKKFVCHAIGGPAIVNSILPPDVEKMKPDYELMGLDYSLGYTFRPCYNSCGFCTVPKMNHPDVIHHSIWEFHDPKFKKICLLNNNTFQDPQWRETFEEIWDADLILIDQNGYDLRLLDDEKAQAIKKTKWGGTSIHFAWDRIQDEALIIHGLKLLTKYKLRTRNNEVYVLIGYDTTEDEDLHRCQVIHDHGLTPYPMPYVKNAYTKKFKRFINLHYYKQYKTIESAWRDYGRGN